MAKTGKKTKKKVSAKIKAVSKSPCKGKKKVAKKKIYPKAKNQIKGVGTKNASTNKKAAVKKSTGKKIAKRVINKSAAAREVANKKFITGRPRKYNPEIHLPIAEVAAALGATNSEISKALGISEDTLYQWTHDYPQFSETIRFGKIDPDNAVEQSLWRRATGYSHEETKVFCSQGEIIKVSITKHYPPEPKCIDLFLKNRKPGQYRERQEAPDDSQQRLEEIVAALKINVATGVAKGTQKEGKD